MAKMKKLPIDDVLHEFRIKALTSPPEAIELTALDQEMSQILAKSNVPQETKLKMYYDALNKFQNVRDILMKGKPVTVPPISENQLTQQVENSLQKNKQEDIKHGEWDFEREEDQKEFYEKIKARLRNTFVSDDGESIYDENERIGKVEDLKHAMKYFLNTQNNFITPSTAAGEVAFLKNLNPKVMNRVSKIIGDTFADEGVDSKYWKKMFPRLGWKLFFKDNKTWRSTDGDDSGSGKISITPSSSPRIVRKRTPSFIPLDQGSPPPPPPSATAKKRNSPSSIPILKMKKKPSEKGGVDEGSIDYADFPLVGNRIMDETKPSTKKKPRKFVGRNEVSPVELSSSPSDNLVQNLRSRTSNTGLLTKKQSGSGRSRVKYIIDFNNWDSLVHHHSK